MDDRTPSAGHNRSGLARYLSPTDVWAMAFGCIIGWGAFVMPGTTFLPIAGPAGTVIAMAISTAIMLVIGRSYSYLMNARPGTGGVYSYAKEAFGRDHAFLCAWFLNLSYISIIFLNSTALFVIARTLFGDLFRFGPCYEVAGYEIYLSEVGLSAAALALISLLFVFGKPFLQKLQTILAVILLAGSITCAAICLPRVRLTDVFSSFGLGGGGAAPVIITIVLLSPWAFVGFDVISLETAHFSFPMKKSGIITVVSIILGGIVYAAMSLISVSALPEGFASWQEYIANLDSLGGVEAVPTFYAVSRIMGTPGLAVMGVTAAAAIFTGIIAGCRASTRILSTMAEDGIISKRFSSTTFSVIFITVISIIFSFLGRNTLEWFVDLTTFGAIIGFGYTSGSACVIAKKNGDRAAAALGRAGTVITIAFAVVLMIPMVTPFETMSPESFLMLAIWCLVGFLFYWKTMKRSSLSDYQGMSVSSTVLFALLFYSALTWHMLTTSAEVEDGPAKWRITATGFITVAVVFVGFTVMLYVQTLLRKRYEKTEREMMRAEESSRAKSRFLFNMSHDIRTPMNAVIGYTHLAAEEKDVPPKVAGYIEKIDQAGKRLLSIINDVLEMSRIESGRMTLEYSEKDIISAVKSSFDMFGDQMAEKKIDYTLDVSDVSDRYVKLDENRFSRVLMNLISNACKFTPEGGSVAVSLSQTGSSGGRASYLLRVKDSGIGMTEKFAKNVFDAFSQERSSTISGIQGTGLGMAITKSIVDLMGGEISVDTAPGKGADFTVTFTLDTAAAPEESADASGAEASGDKASGDEASGDKASVAEEAAKDPYDILKGRRVLLAEDIAVNREIAAAMLGALGVSVETAENGEEAAEAVSSSEPGRFDAVLMDIQMPVMNGYDAAKEIRALGDKRLADVPIIAMTANAFDEDRKKAAECGMNGHIPKPVDPAVLADTLIKAIEGSGAAKQ